MSCFRRPQFQIHDTETDKKLAAELRKMMNRHMKDMKDAINKGNKLSEGSEWMHKQSGKLYKIICITNLMATKPDFQPQVVYEDEEFSIWSRPLSEWEAKFKYIKPA